MVELLSVSIGKSTGIPSYISKQKIRTRDAEPWFLFSIVHCPSPVGVGIVSKILSGDSCNRSSDGKEFRFPLDYRIEWDYIGSTAAERQGD